VPLRRQCRPIKVESEILHRRKYGAQLVENLGYGRDLPIEMSATDNNHQSIDAVSLAGIRSHDNRLLMKSELGTPKPEVLCCSHKLQEVWDGIGELVKKQYLELLEDRGVDPGKNSFQVSTNSLEPEPAKVRKCDVSHGWGIQQPPLDVTVGNRGMKTDP
jgi:hypothetical protein